MYIRRLEEPDMYPALKIAWYTFSKQVSSRVGETETKTFAEAATLEMVSSKAKSEQLYLFGSFNEDNEITGMLALEPDGNIPMFFVKPEVQHGGIGRMLYQTAYNFYARTFGTGKLTIRCLPEYADIIGNLGFKFVSDTPGIPYRTYEIYVIHGLVMPVTEKKKKVPEIAVFLGAIAILIVLAVAIAGMGIHIYHNYVSNRTESNQDQVLPDEQVPNNQNPGSETPDTQIPDNQLPDNQLPDSPDDNYGSGEDGNDTDSASSSSGLEAIDAYIKEDLSYETSEDQYTYSSDQSSDVTVYMTVTYPVIKGLDDKTVQKKINAAIKESALQTVDEIYTNPTDEIKERVIESQMPVLAVSGTYKITYATDELLCVVLQDQSYQGDTSHTAIHLRTLNFNLKDGTVYELKDIVNIDDSFIDAWLTSIRGEVDSSKSSAFLSELTEDQLKEALEGNPIGENYIVQYFIDKDGIEIGFDLNYEENDSNDQGYGWVTGPFSFDEIKNYEKSSDFWSN